MKRIFAVFMVLLFILTLFSVIAIASESGSETKTETVTDRADDPASYEKKKKKRVQTYIIVALFALGLVTVVVMIIKNYAASK